MQFSSSCITLPQSWAHSQCKTPVWSMSLPLKTALKELKQIHKLTVINEKCNHLKNKMFTKNSSFHIMHIHITTSVFYGLCHKYWE